MAKKKAVAEETAAALNQFELDGKKYNVVHGISIHLASGLAKLTPADICVNEEAQQILVAGGSSAIKEVIE